MVLICIFYCLTFLFASSLSVWLRQRFTFFNKLKQDPYKNYITIFVNSTFDILFGLFPSIVLMAHHEYTELYLIVISVFIALIHFTAKEAILNPFQPS